MLIENCTLIEPLWCKTTQSVREVAKTLRDKQQRRIIVLKQDKPVGIISTTDMNNRVVAENLVAADLKAEDIMSSPLDLICNIGDDITDIYKKMVEKKAYFVPVLKENEFIGVLTYGELVKQVRGLLHGKKTQ
ncbi:MAG: hypothetical protein MAG795_00776 [Candidatus Woesearchaeota archaeon]|nr:hypothetical protein [Candidatus Woesearchaeota archaeon]